MNTILKYLTFEHLPQKLQEVSKPFCDLAHFINDTIADS